MVCLELQNVLDIVYARLTKYSCGNSNNGKMLEPMQQQFEGLATIVNQTLNDSEGNSLLLVGPRGSGKRSTLKQVLENVQEDFTTVHLNGFLHTDDRLALRDFIRQLQLEGAVESITQTGSVADHLRTILGLFSDGAKKGLHFKSSKRALVVVLEEFEMFASHYNQSLLYILFDIAQSSPFPLLIVGITCCIDAVDELEKRVKSRFSHRHIYFPGPQGNCVDLLENWLLIATDIGTSARQRKATTFASKWNESVRALLQDARVQNLLSSFFENTHDIKLLYHVFLRPLSQLTPESPFLRAEKFLPQTAPNEIPEQRPSVLFFEPKLEILASLSVLNLCLLAAMKRYADRGIFNCNFEMVYEEYRLFLTQTHTGGWTNRQKGDLSGGSGNHVRGNGSMTEQISGTLRMFAFKKPIALKAFDLLAQLQLITPVSGTCAQSLREYRMFRLQVLPEYVEYAVLYLSQLPTPFKRWVCNTSI